jgi:hypothetical protein
MEQIIKENSTFKFDEFEVETKSKMESKWKVKYLTH